MEEDRAQYDLGRQSALISASSWYKILVSMNVSLAKMFYQKSKLLKKAATAKRFEYSPLGS